MGIGLQTYLWGWNAHMNQCADRLSVSCTIIDITVRPECFNNLRVDTEYWIKGCHGILKNHGDGGPSEPSHTLFGQTDDILSLKQNPSIDNLSRRIYQSDDRESGDGFTRT